MSGTSTRLRCSFKVSATAAIAAALTCRSGTTASTSPSDEARWFGGAQHQTFRHIFLEAGEHLIELAEHIHGERVGARARLVEREPGDALIVVREPPVAPGRGRAGALGLGERPQLEIARRERVPDYAHLRSIILET